MDTSDSESDFDSPLSPIPKPKEVTTKKKMEQQTPPPNWQRSLKLVENAALNGDRILLSPHALQELIHAATGPNQTLPSPLFFQLTNTNNNLKAYGSVREFTAQSDYIVEVSPLIAEWLQLSTSSSSAPTAQETKGKQVQQQGQQQEIESDEMQQDELDNVDDGEYPMPLRTQPAPAADCIVKCVTLPKCEYLKIAPLEATYLEIPDLRALLESHLRQNFSTITESTTLSVPLTIKYSSTTTTTTTPSSEIHRFLITECKPETVCSCIDVDINLDVVPLEGGGVAEEAVRRKFFGGDRNTVVVGGGGVHDAADGITEVVLVEGGGGGSSSSSSSRGVLGSVNGVVEKGECRYFRVKTVKSGDRGGGGGTYRVEAVPLVSGSGSGGGGGGSSGTGISSGDCNVFVSLSMVERPGLMEHDHYNVDTGVSVVEFGIGSGGGDGGVDDDSDNDVPHLPFIYIAVQGYTERTSFQLNVSWSPDQFQAPSSSQQNNTVSLLDEPVPDGHVQCDNCYQHVPSRTFTMHQAFCLRNNVVCNRCRTEGGGAVFLFKKEEFANHWHCDSCSLVSTVAASVKHLEMEHGMRHACVCGQDLPLKSLAGHKKRECPDRLIICRYCRLRVRAGPKSMVAKDIYSGLGLCEHESVCGSRTIECIKCQANVQLKDVKLHAQFHEVQKQNQKAPLLCPNSQCSNRPNAQFPNPLGLCQPCFSPFWSPRHDPGNQKLTSKLLSTYHSQLTTGCGRVEHCGNSYCATGKGGVPMDATGAAVVAFEVLKKSGLFASQKAEYHLCVADAKNAKRRAAANTLAEMGFQVSWAVKALEESRDSTEAGLTWLLQNAPKLKNK